MIVDLRSGPGYTVTLVGSDGRIAAQAHAALRSVIPDPGAAELPYVSISRTRVYYLDGDSAVRWVDATGATGAGQQLPGTKTTPVAFAVSPDDSHIAVSRFDFSATPVLVQLYTDTIGGGSQRFSYKSQSNFIWPIGWHGGSLVLAAQTFPPYTQSGARWNPYFAMSYHVVDPDNADRLFTLGSGEDQQNGCQPTGPLTAAGTACSQYGAVSNGAGTVGIIDWSGHFHNTGPGHLPSSVAVSSVSPDAVNEQQVFCCDTFQNFALVRSGLIVETKLPGQISSPDWACWLDGTHLLSGSFQGGTVRDAQGNPVSSTFVATYTMGAKAATPVSAAGFCAGVLPAALG